jgi:hypothetical protein
MANNRDHARKPTDLPGSQSRFALPPDVSFTKQRMAYGWAYIFRHRTLGELGRILLQDRPDGRCQLSCEVVGDPADPRTAERAAIFQPLALALSARIQAATGPVTDPDLAPPPPLPPEPKQVVESKLIPCERCGAMAALLIFAPEATDPGRFEDYARLMYPEYTRLICDNRWSRPTSIDRLKRSSTVSGTCCKLAQTA